MPLAKIQHPLTRRGHGPGLIIITEDTLDFSKKERILDPEPVRKWAEEGFAIADVVVGADDADEMLDGAVNAGVEALTAMDECDDKTKFGIIAYLSPSTRCISALLREHPYIVGTVFFNFSPPWTGRPMLAHVPGSPTEQPTTAESGVKQYFYPSADVFFVIPGHPSYHPASAGLAHTRTLSFLKPLLGGPIFDIEAVWEEHTLHEFGDPSVEKTMATMVEEPSINNVPAMTGGVGRKEVSAFYQDHFIFNNPEDMELQLVSRTIGVDRVIDEFVCHMTHDKTLDWILPGVPPTGKKLAVPVTSVIGVRGDRLHNEHITWDQATVLRQLGLLPEYLTFPYPINGKSPPEGARFEYRLPVGGVEVANRLLDERSVESNGMFSYRAREVSNFLG